MYWEVGREKMDREELKQMQLEQLQAVLARVYMHVPSYRKKFDEFGIDPDEFRSLEDLKDLPFTAKDDLNANYPYGMFAVPLREIVRIHASSDMSAVVGYTNNDIKLWSNLVARMLTAGGVSKDDVVQVAYGYSLLTGGFGIHYGAEKIGASVIPISTGNTSRQIKIMRDFKTTAFVSTPSYAMHVAQTILRSGIGPGNLSLKYGLFGGEPWSESSRNSIEEMLHIKATDNYGLSEVMGPGIACECLEQSGMHIQEDHFLAEIVDPETLQPLKPGEKGELVITTLTKEAFPVIRFRTRDLTRLITEPCKCGRTTIRMERISGRTDDMLIIKGVNIYPSQVGAVLSEVEGTEPNFQIIVERTDSLDEMTIMVEVSEDSFFDEVKKHQALIETIRKKIFSSLGVSARIKVVEKKTLGQHKPGMVIDKR